MASYDHTMPPCPNAGKVGGDYQRIFKEVGFRDDMEFSMAPGGGWSARFVPIAN